MSVRVADDRADEAIAVIGRHNAVDTTARGDAYRSGGWTQFDEAAPAYIADQVSRERAQSAERR